MIRRFSIAIATVAAASALTLGSATTATAAPDTGSGSGSGSSSSEPARSAADYQFLRATDYDDSSVKLQDAVISLAHTQCDYLDTNGNTARNRIYLAEESRGAITYPYLFLSAAIDAYCPWNRR
ncbi:DUF732 domain-containing protein [Nocardia camponoti]|uniref:DUF732 domain-containing protein n=1 Tax=Nocardia camponoti TaxID=1616106 RepID=A0A917QF71_9NOCA|nr:DUF732 domain-containing protein [Nocardia camponoti]GGK46146.1 hypothetical protein GCM10011591_16930 [Nocardia camponoti]